jgi:translation initiation factor 5B
MISPFYFPVTAGTFNFACVIFGAVTTFAILTWYFTPADKWLRQEQIERAMRTAEGSAAHDHAVGTSIVPELE